MSTPSFTVQLVEEVGQYSFLDCVASMSPTGSVCPYGLLLMPTIDGRCTAAVIVRSHLPRRLHLTEQVEHLGAHLVGEIRLVENVFNSAMISWRDLMSWSS